jgi:hypothetical protein
LIVIWQDSLLFGMRALTKSSMSFSSELISPNMLLQALSTYTWHVAHAHEPPQSASIPGTPFFTAAAINETPAGAWTECSVPSCSINETLTMQSNFLPDRAFGEVKDPPAHGFTD